jgi:hypothetical protein
MASSKRERKLVSQSVFKCRPGRESGETVEEDRGVEPRAFQPRWFSRPVAIHIAVPSKALCNAKSLLEISPFLGSASTGAVQKKPCSASHQAFNPHLRPFRPVVLHKGSLASKNRGSDCLPKALRTKRGAGHGYLLHPVKGRPSSHGDERLPARFRGWLPEATSVSDELAAAPYDRGRQTPERQGAARTKTAKL